MTRDIELNQAAVKPLGKYLVEAGIVTSTQLKTALYEQKNTEKRIGEILSDRGWVKQETIEYFVEKVVLPEREIDEKNLLNRALYQSITQSNADLNIYLSPRKIIWFLLVLAFSIVSASVLIQVGTYILPGYPLQNTLFSLFNIDGEQTIPAFFSWSILLFCALLLGAIAYSKRIDKDRYTSQWTALAIIFLCMSVDEAIGIHERISLILEDKFNTSGFFYFAWTIPGSIFVVVCLLLFLRFIAHLSTRTRNISIVAGSVYIGGSLLMEMCNGYYESLYGAGLTYYIFTTIEESMEILGIIIFIYGLLSYISSSMKGISLRVNIPAQKGKN